MQLNQPSILLNLLRRPVALVIALPVGSVISQQVDTDLQSISTNSDIGTYFMLGILGLAIIVAVASIFILVRQRRVAQNSRQR